MAGGQFFCFRMSLSEIGLEAHSETLDSLPFLPPSFDPDVKGALDPRSGRTNLSPSFLPPFIPVLPDQHGWTTHPTAGSPALCEVPLQLHPRVWGPLRHSVWP